MRVGMPELDDVFSCSVVVGQACTQAPHDTHSDSMNGSSGAGRRPASRSRGPAIVSANVPCTSSQARTQREQTMHFARIEVEVRVAECPCRRPRWFSPLVAVAHVAQPDLPAMSCSSQSPLADAGAGSRAGGRRCRAPSRRGAARSSLSVCVRDLHARRCTASCTTRACRGRPRSRRGTAGTSRTPRGCRWRTASGRRCRPAAAARMTDVPSGTVTAVPSISTLDGRPVARRRAGVPKSGSWMQRHAGAPPSLAVVVGLLSVVRSPRGEVS